MRSMPTGNTCTTASHAAVPIGQTSQAPVELHVIRHLFVVHIWMCVMIVPAIVAVPLQTPQLQSSDEHVLSHLCSSGPPALLALTVELVVACCLEAHTARPGSLGSEFVLHPPIRSCPVNRPVSRCPPGHPQFQLLSSSRCGCIIIAAVAAAAAAVARDAAAAAAAAALAMAVRAAVCAAGAVAPVGITVHGGIGTWRSRRRRRCLAPFAAWFAQAPAISSAVRKSTTGGKEYQQRRPLLAMQDWAVHGGRSMVPRGQRVSRGPRKPSAE